MLRHYCPLSDVAICYIIIASYPMMLYFAILLPLSRCCCIYVTSLYPFTLCSCMLRRYYPLPDVVVCCVINTPYPMLLYYVITCPLPDIAVYDVTIAPHTMFLYVTSLNRKITTECKHVHITAIAVML